MPRKTRDPSRPSSTARPRRNRAQAAQEQRQLTRAKLLRAGYRLFAERGKDAVSVNDITDAADVGFGSFYNHFASKDVFHDALVEAFIEDVDANLSCRVWARDDVAYVIALTVRYAVERAGTDMVWRRFLLREAFTGRFQARGIEARLRDAIRSGLDSGRFRLLEPRVGSLATAGGLIGVVAGALSRGEVDEGPASAASVRGLGVSTAATMLAALGLDATEARAFAERPPRAPPRPRGRTDAQSDRALLFDATAPTTPGTARPDG